MPLSPGEKLGPYEVLEPIGKGGMGEVWKAHDPRLDRDIAIKVSSAQFSERFERETKAIAALNHPHICQIYDVGPNYLVMEYIEGTPVTGPLPLAKALEYAAQIASALDAAHSKRIIHRDLKPANILTTTSGVKLVDFGLAKVETTVGQPDATQSVLTEAGAVLGTAAYMSPEQARGEEVDARSDVFSFGVVLYEMLTGTRPFRGTNTVSLLYSIVFQEPDPVERLRADVPRTVLEITSRCLRKDRSDRYQTMKPILAELEMLLGSYSSSSYSQRTVAASKSWRAWLFGAGGPLIVGGAILGLWTFSHHTATVDNADAPELVRRGRALLKRYDNPANRDRALQLFQRAAQLDPNNAPAFAGLADTYCFLHASNPDDQLIVAASANARRAVEINSLLSAAHESMGDVYLEQRQLQDAERELRRALELDPSNADAQLNVALTLHSLSRSKEAEEVLRKLIAASPDDWRAYHFLGSVLTGIGRYQDAVTVLTKAGELASDSAIVFRLLGMAYGKLGRDTEAIAAYQRALAVRPTAGGYAAIGAIYYYGGRYADAATAFDRAVKLSANDALHWANLGDVYRFLPGNDAKSKQAYGEAIRITEERLDKAPSDLRLRTRLAMYLAKSGQKQAAGSELNKIPVSASLDSTSLYSLAMTSQFLGDSTAALRYLAKAVKAGYSTAELAADPDLITLRRDPRYHLEVIPRQSAATSIH